MLSHPGPRHHCPYFPPQRSLYSRAGRVTFSAAETAGCGPAGRTSPSHHRQSGEQQPGGEIVPPLTLSVLALKTIKGLKHTETPCATPGTATTHL